MLKDFFKKDVTAYPSGKHAPADKARSSRHGHTLAKAGMFLAAVVTAVSMSSCGGPSPEKIQAMKDSVPEPVKKELVAKCDSAILANIQTSYQKYDRMFYRVDSLAAARGRTIEREEGHTASVAIVDGFKKAQAEILDTMPEPSKMTGEHYILVEHLNKCAAEAMDTREKEITVAGGSEGIHQRTVVVDHGKPEYMEILSNRVKNRQAQKVAFAAKAAQFNR